MGVCVEAASAPDSVGPVDGVAPLSHPAWWTQLWVHSIALAVLLVALVPVFDSVAPTFPDEGLYSAQVDNLSKGSWSSERPAADIDPEGRGQAMAGALVDGDRQIPYARRPAYPLLLTPAYVVFGSAGLLLVSALATWAAALGSALLARRIDRRLDVPTLWLAGVGSPLLFDAYLVMGHGVAAALVAWLVVAACHAVDDRRLRWLAVGLPAAALVVLLRSEGTIVVAAVAGVLAASAFLPTPRSPDPLRFGTGCAVAATGATAFLLDGWLARQFSGGLQSDTGSVVSETDPLNAAWTDLLRPWYGDGGNAAASSVMGALCLVAAVAALKLAPRRTTVPLALLVVAGALSVVRLVEPVDLISGLIPAFPAALAIVLLRWSDLRDPVVARLLAVAAVSVAGLLLTVYGDLDAAQWGGRFFHILVPLLAPLAVLGLVRGAEGLGPRERIVAGVAVAVVILSMSALALRVNREGRDANSDLVAGTIELVDQQANTDRPLVVLGTRVPSGLSRTFWRPLSDGAQLTAQGNPAYLFRVLLAAQASGREELFLVTDLRPDTLRLILGPVLSDTEWRVASEETVTDTAFTVYRLAPEASS